MKKTDCGAGPARWTVVFAAALGLVACGGGGGSSNGGGGSGGPVAEPVPTSAAPLTLTAQNLHDVATTAPGAAESLLEIGQLAVDYAGRYAAGGTTTEINETCPNGGALTLTWVDVDRSSTLSAGDQVNVALRDCGVVVWNAILNGSFVVTLSGTGATAAAGMRGTVATIGAVTINDYAGQVNTVKLQLQGGLAFDSSKSDFLTSLSVTSTAADDLRLVATNTSNGASVTERLRKAAVSRILQFDQARVQTNVALVYESEALGGSITVSTPQPLQAYLNTYPEAGQLLVRGANSAVVKLTPHFALGSSQFDAALDGNGDGAYETSASYLWTEAVDGYLFWDGITAPPWSSKPYTTQDFSTTGFSYRLTDLSTLGVNGTARLQFSRPPVAAPMPLFRFRDQGPVSGYDPVLANVSGIASSQGALFLIRPQTQLRHARQYALEMSTDSGANWTSSLSLRDALGNAVMLSSYLGGFATADSLRAVAKASGGLLASATATLQLDGTGSTGMRPIASYRWTQLGGTPLNLSAPQSAVTQVSWGSQTPSGVEKISMQLTVTDTAGESETTVVAISLINPAATGHVLYFRSSSGDYIGGGQVFLGGDSTGSFGANPVNSGYVTFSYNGNGYLEWWTLTLATADNSPLHVGAYENAVRAPFHSRQNGLELSGSGRGCNEIVGRYDVLEIATDSSNVITRLAVDFEQHCESATAPPLFGSLRINSSIPIRP